MTAQIFCYGATFRMGVLIPNCSKDIMVKGQNVPHFSKMSGDKMRNGTSNIFQILGDIQKQQLLVQSQYNSRVGISFQDHHTFNTSTDNGDSKQVNPVYVNALPMQKLDLQHLVHMSTSHHLRF